MLYKCPNCDQVMVDLEKVSWVCEGCGHENEPINFLMTTCEKCSKPLDSISCKHCNIDFLVSDIIDKVMFVRRNDQEKKSTGGLTLLDIYKNSNKEGVLNTSDVERIPDAIWHHDIREQLPSANASKYKSAVLTRSFSGGLRNGQPYKRSYLFFYYSDLFPTSESHPVASLTFTIDLTDDTLFVESPWEF